MGFGYQNFCILIYFESSPTLSFADFSILKFA